MKLGDFQAALDQFENSLDMAKVQGDKAAESAIKKAIDDINSRIVGGVNEDKQQEETPENSPGTSLFNLVYVQTCHLCPQHAEARRN